MSAVDQTVTYLFLCNRAGQLVFSSECVQLPRFFFFLVVGGGGGGVCFIVLALTHQGCMLCKNVGINNDQMCNVC